MSLDAPSAQRAAAAWGRRRDRLTAFARLTASARPTAPARLAARARFALLTAALFVPARGVAQQKSTTPAARDIAGPAMDKVDRRYAVAPDLSFRLSGSVGALRVTGWDRDSLAVIGAIPRGTRFEMGIGGDGRSPARGAKAYLEAPNDAIASSAVLEIRLPTRGRIWIKSGSSNVEVRGIAGGVDVNVIGGSVRIASSPRELQVESMDANVVIDGSPSWLRAKTATGDIDFSGTTSDAVLTSVSGAIRLEKGSVERARLESVTGGITLGASLARGADVSIDSHSGPIDVRLPAQGDFELTASSITGTIDNQYDNRRTIAGREGRGEELAFGRGAGSSRLAVRSFKGTIILRKSGA